MAYSGAYIFFFNDTATTEIYTLSLHDALPISLTPRSPTRRPTPRSPTRPPSRPPRARRRTPRTSPRAETGPLEGLRSRSEEHTSELQSRQYLVCRLLLEKKNKEVIADLNYAS